MSRQVIGYDLLIDISQVHVAIIAEFRSVNVIPEEQIHYHADKSLRSRLLLVISMAFNVYGYTLNLV